MTDQTIRFKDCGIYYLVYENPTKETIVMLHPYASSGLLFDSQIMALKRDFQLVLIDMPGHGKSSVSRNVTFRDMPEIIRLVLQEIEVESAHFIGVSEGSVVAQGFAQAFPKQLKSLVSISAYSIFHESDKAIRGELRLTRIKHFFLRWFSFKHYKKFFILQSALSNQGMDKFAKTMKGFKRRSIKAKKGLSRFSKMGRQTSFYPTYVVCGEHDLEVIKDASMQHGQKVPMATIEGYPNTKQIVFLDNPRLFNDHLMTFLKNVDRIETDYARRSKSR